MNDPVEIICPECGELLIVKDIRAFILAMHENRSCEAMEKVLGPPG